MPDYAEADNASSDREVSKSCIDTGKKAMKLKDLMIYFGALKDSDILDELRDDIRVIRELQ